MIPGHTALTAAGPISFATWYDAIPGPRRVRHLPQAIQARFLTDHDAGAIKGYRNPTARVPDYLALHHLILHLAFQSAAIANAALFLTSAHVSAQISTR